MTDSVELGPHRDKQRFGYIGVQLRVGKTGHSSSMPGWHNQSASTQSISGRAGPSRSSASMIV